MAKNKGKMRSADDGAPEIAEGLGGVPEVDEFIHVGNRAALAVRSHLPAVIVGVLGLVVLLIGAGTYSWYRGRQAEQASALYQEAVDALGARIIAPDDPPPLPGDESKTFPSAAKRSEATIAALDALKKDFPGHAVTESAELLRGRALLDLGRHDDAVAAFQAFVGTSPTPVLAVTAKEGLAYAEEAKALAAEGDARASGLSKALAAFKDMAPDPKGFGGDRSLYHQGRIKQELGDKAGAKEMFASLVGTWPESPLKADAERRILLMEL